MEGEPVQKYLLIASDDAGAGSLVCCELMQIDPYSVPHLRLAVKEAMMPSSLEQISLNTNLAPFITQKFYLERSLLHWITLGIFHSRLATIIAYDSALTKPLHNVL